MNWDGQELSTKLSSYLRLSTLINWFEKRSLLLSKAYLSATLFTSGSKEVVTPLIPTVVHPKILGVTFGQHLTNHLFNCRKPKTTLTMGVDCVKPTEVASFLRLEDADKRWVHVFNAATFWDCYNTNIFLSLLDHFTLKRIRQVCPLPTIVPVTLCQASEQQNVVR